MERAYVQLVSVVVSSGRKTAMPRAGAYTNDLGEYRVGGLGAGTYYIAVNGQPWYGQSAPQSDDRTGPALAYAPVFYPNASDAHAATPLTLKPGQEATADFTLRTTTGFDVTIRCRGSGPDSRRSLRVVLTSDGMHGAKLYERVATGYACFAHIPSVPIGRYTVSVLNEADMQYLGSRPIAVTSSNVDVQFDLQDKVSVSATIELDGTGGNTPARLLVTLRDELSGLGSGHSVAPNGSVTLPNLPPGRYRVGLLSEKRGFNVRLILNDRELGEPVLGVGSVEVRGLRILASAGAGGLRGLVYRKGRPVPGTLVVLLPANEPGGHGFSHSFMTDSDGSFDWDMIPPGEYRLVVTDDFDLEYANPAVRKSWASRGKLVRVELNGMTEENLEVE